MPVDTIFLRGQAHLERNTYDVGQYDFTDDVIEMCDELDRLYLVEKEYEHAVVCMDRFCARCRQEAEKRGLMQ